MSDELIVFTREEVSAAYQCLRRHEKSIPDECLDQMRRVLLQAVADRRAYATQPKESSDGM